MSTRFRRPPESGPRFSPNTVYKVGAERTFDFVLITERRARVLSASRQQGNQQHVQNPDTLLQRFNLIHPGSVLMALVRTFHCSGFGLVRMEEV